MTNTFEPTRTTPQGIRVNAVAPGATAINIVAEVNSQMAGERMVRHLEARRGPGGSA